MFKLQCFCLKERHTTFQKGQNFNLPPSITKHVFTLMPTLNEVAVFLILTYLSIPVLMYISSRDRTRPLVQPSELPRARRVLVLVLGDLLQSPRMAYHCRSLARNGIKVELCGYIAGDTPREKVKAEILGPEEDKVQELVDLHVVKQIKTKNKALKMLLMHWALWTSLSQIIKQCLKDGSRTGIDYILVQNPPSVPTFAVVKAINLLWLGNRAKLIIDWHNFGFSIMASITSNWYMIKIYEWYELYFGFNAFYHLTVTHKMKQHLVNRYGFDQNFIVTMHDRPFAAASEIPKTKQSTDDELITEIIELKKTHPEHRVLVTATSYTPDENLYMLVDAAKKYDSDSDSTLPSLTIVITGRGPLYDEIRDFITETKFKRVTFKQHWFSMQNYRKILRLADLSVSLHESSSGYDLPMKILDYFSAGLPVIALDFLALDELVINGKNGVVVDRNADALATGIRKVLAVDEDGFCKLQMLQKGTQVETRMIWSQNWDQYVAPLFGITNGETSDEE